MSATVIEVVSAAVVSRDPSGARMLLSQRAGTSTHGWRWCTPGGKVEAGETITAALKRELVEEIDWSHRDPLSVAGLLYTYEGERTNGGRFRLRCYLLAAPARAPWFRPVVSQGIVGVGWFDADSIKALPLAQADAAMREHLLTSLGSGS